MKTIIIPQTIKSNYNFQDLATFVLNKIKKWKQNKQTAAKLLENNWNFYNWNEDILIQRSQCIKDLFDADFDFAWSVSTHSEDEIVGISFKILFK